jgi:hypothetical protein
MPLRFTETVDDRLIEIISNYRVLNVHENIDFKNVPIKKIWEAVELQFEEIVSTTDLICLLLFYAVYF